MRFHGTGPFLLDLPILAGGGCAMFLAMAWAFASAALYHPSSSVLGAAAGEIALGGGLEKVAGREGGVEVVTCPEVCRTGASASSLTSILGRLAVADDEACSRCLSCIV